MSINLENEIVIHKTLGEGRVLSLEVTKILIEFVSGEKKFVFPDAFKAHLKAQNSAINEQIHCLITEIEDEIERKRKAEEEKQKEIERIKQKALEDEKKKTEKQNTDEKKKKINEKDEHISTKKSLKPTKRTNIAFKCNFCDGGKSNKQVGFNGVCSDNLIRNNIVIEKRTWCNSEECPCFDYYNKNMSRKELDSMCAEGGFVCYESQMLRDWKAMAGIVQHGENKGRPMKLMQVQTNSLCVLTTRDPQSSEEDRYIFAVFLVDDTYEGDGREEGYVSTKSEFKIKLNLDEAHSLLFWNYHANDNKPNVPLWSSGLHRYFDDAEAVQILRDIAKIKRGSKEEELSEKFLQHFSRINGVDISTIGEPYGALKK